MMIYFEIAFAVLLVVGGVIADRLAASHRRQLEESERASRLHNIHDRSRR